MGFDHAHDDHRSADRLDLQAVCQFDKPIVLVVVLVIGCFSREETALITWPFIFFPLPWPVERVPQTIENDWGMLERAKTTTDVLNQADHV
jgi:hypothetical protein